MEHKRSNFTGTIGFVMAAAGSAVGLGNIWRFPYLAAKDNGGVFIFCYIILALTFGFTLLTTEIAIGRKTAQSPLTAYAKLNKKWGFLGVLASLVPTIILPYYCAIGGWVVKYLTIYATGQGKSAVSDSYFTEYIVSDKAPVIFTVIFLAATAFIVFSGVNKGIEKYSKILMPVLFLLIIGIAVYSLTLSHTDETGKTRTGLQGLKVYLVPDFSGMTLKELEDRNDPFLNFFNDPVHFETTNGCETHREVIGRAVEFLEDMILPNERKYQHVAVFSHGAWIHSLLTHIYGRDIEEFWHAPRQENCGVTTIEVKDGTCHVLKESEIFYNKDGE